MKTQKKDSAYTTSHPRRIIPAVQTFGGEICHFVVVRGTLPKSYTTSINKKKSVSPSFSLTASLVSSGSVTQCLKCLKKLEASLIKLGGLPKPDVQKFQKYIENETPFYGFTVLSLSKSLQAWGLKPKFESWGLRICAFLKLACNLDSAQKPGRTPAAWAVT